MAKERIAYYDMLRGLAIIMVVAQHVPGLELFGSLEGNVNIVLREIWGAAVPLFLAISGFFIARKPMNTSGDYLTFIKKQIPRVYIPCLIWSLPILALWIFKGDGVVKSVAKIMACMAHGPYYFIALIIQLYLLHPLFVYTTKSRMGGVVFGINLLSVIVLDYLIIGIDMPFVVLVGPFVYWMMFYYLGVNIAIKKPNMNLKTLIPAAIIAFCCQLIEAYFIGPGIKASTWIWSYLAIMILFSGQAKDCFMKHERVLLPLAFIGRYSFGIYLVHVYTLMVVGRLNLSTLWIVQYAMVFCITIFCVWMLDKVMPNKFVKYLGLK